MSPQTLVSLGESRFKRVLYNHAAGRLVAQFERDDGPRHLRSLYIRDPATNVYERLATPHERTSYDSPVVARSLPTVFFNAMAIADNGGGDWIHVARADILTHEIEILFTSGELARVAGSDPKWPLQPWISGLTDVSDDGAILTCTIGLPEPRANGAFHMSYGLFDLEVSTRTLTRLAKFENTPYW